MVQSGVRIRLVASTVLSEGYPNIEGKPKPEIYMDQDEAQIINALLMICKREKRWRAITAGEIREEINNNQEMHQFEWKATMSLLIAGGEIHLFKQDHDGPLYYALSPEMAEKFL